MSYSRKLIKNIYPKLRHRLTSSTDQLFAKVQCIQTFGVIYDTFFNRHWKKLSFNDISLIPEKKTFSLCSSYQKIKLLRILSSVTNLNTNGGNVNFLFEKHRNFQR